MKINLKYICVTALLLGISSETGAHTINYDLSELSGTTIGWLYFKLGFAHILPLGLDHILFVLGLFFLNPNLKYVIAQATVFTVAHSITLGLTFLGYIQPPSSIIEPIIALSILFIAMENLITTELKWWRLLIVFVFGLIHGCGFASALAETGLAENHFLMTLLSFNLGVEAGQITVILVAWLLVGKWFSEKPWYRKRIVIPVSCLIGCMALYWTIERTLNL